MDVLDLPVRDFKKARQIIRRERRRGLQAQTFEWHPGHELLLCEGPPFGFPHAPAREAFLFFVLFCFSLFATAQFGFPSIPRRPMSCFLVWRRGRPRKKTRYIYIYNIDTHLPRGLHGDSMGIHGSIDPCSGLRASAGHGHGGGPRGPAPRGQREGQGAAEEPEGPHTEPMSRWEGGGDSDRLDRLGEGGRRGRRVGVGFGEIGWVGGKSRCGSLEIWEIVKCADG